MSDDDELLLTLTVLGKCEPQGSATAFVPLKDGYPIARGGRLPDGRYRNGSVVVNVTSDNPNLKKWRTAVANAARRKWDVRPPIEDESLHVEACFFLKRPENHWRSGRFAHLLKDDAPATPTTIPDVDKLLRAILDALTGIIYRDDGLVTSAPPEKRYAVPSEANDGRGVRIMVYRRAEQTALDLPEEERVRYVEPTPGEVDAAQLALSQ